MIDPGCTIEKGQRASAGDRPDDDDPSTRATKRRQECLGDRDLADDVDLELATQVVGREELERRRDSDARVVDETRELLDPLRGGANLFGISDVEQYLFGSRRRLSGPANAGEDAPA